MKPGVGKQSAGEAKSREEPLSLVLFCSVSLGVFTLHRAHLSLRSTGETGAQGLRARDTHHPFLPLNHKIENIPLEVERQQGWGSDWGGKGDGGGVSKQGSERAAMVRWPQHRTASCQPLAAPPLLHQP